jgi:hypothetical protein
VSRFDSPRVLPTLVEDVDGANPVKIIPIRTELITQDTTDYGVETVSSEISEKHSKL